MCFEIMQSICPCCREKLDSAIGRDEETTEGNYLEFWRMLGDQHLYICTKCKKKELSQEELLRIGFQRGFRVALDKNREASNKVESPFGPNSCSFEGSPLQV